MARRDGLNTPEKLTLLRSMVPFIRANGPVPIIELASHFEITPELARALVRLIALSGVPGDTKTYLPNDMFDIDWDALEQDDEALIINSIVSDDAPALSGREIAAILAGLQYLKAVPGLALREEIDLLIQKLAGTAIVNPPLIEVRAVAPASLQMIRDAISTGHSLRFEHRKSPAEITNRHVQPYSLESVDEVWYLLGWCADRREERLFRISRMSNIEAHPPIQAAPTSDQNRPSSTSLYAPAADAITARVRVGEQWLSRIRSFEPTIIRSSNSSTDVEIELAVPARASWVVAASAGNAEVLEPHSARTAVAAWAARALSQYDL